MKNLTQLLKQHKRVWFYLEDDAVKSHFLEEVIQLGLVYRDGSAPKEVGMLMGISWIEDEQRYSIGYIASTTWYIARTTPGNPPVMINYHQYLLKGDYIVKKVISPELEEELKLKYEREGRSITFI